MDRRDMQWAFTEGKIKTAMKEWQADLEGVTEEKDGNIPAIVMRDVLLASGELAQQQVPHTRRLGPKAHLAYQIGGWQRYLMRKISLAGYGGPSKALWTELIAVALWAEKLEEILSLLEQGHGDQDAGES